MQTSFLYEPNKPPPFEWFPLPCQSVLQCPTESASKWNGVLFFRILTFAIITEIFNQGMVIGNILSWTVAFKFYTHYRSLKQVLDFSKKIRVLCHMSVSICLHFKGIFQSQYSLFLNYKGILFIEIDHSEEKLCL